jgi:hypothetical protein
MIIPFIIFLIVIVILLLYFLKRKTYKKKIPTSFSNDYYTETVKRIKISNDLQKIWSLPHKDQKLCVAIVEPRIHELLPYVLYNMANIYGGEDVSLYIFHGTKNEEYVKDIIRGWKNVQLINLNVENLTIDNYNNLLISKSFYENFISKFVLIFQTDSLIRRKIDSDFFNYDYVGAPWKDNCQVCVGNGGFSLRKVETMKLICEKYKNVYGNEDLFFSHEVQKNGFNLPDVETASRFSSEWTLHPDPCGFHAINKFHRREEVEKLLQIVL